MIFFNSMTFKKSIVLTMDFNLSAYTAQVRILNASVKDFSNIVHIN